MLKVKLPDMLRLVKHIVHNEVEAYTYNLYGYSPYTYLHKFMISFFLLFFINRFICLYHI